MSREIPNTILALAVLSLTAIPIGTAVFLLGFVHGDSPCVMCWQQRTAMAQIALVGLFVLRYGPRPQYVGLGVLTGALGLYMAVRQTALHAARDIGQGFSVEILGAHTYTWSALIFWICVATMAGLLLLVSDVESSGRPRVWRPIDRLAGWVFLIVLGGNIVQSFASTGPPPFMGQSDPVRFSFHPKNWVWSLEEWDVRTPITWRGRWAVERPGAEALPTSPVAGPIANLPVLSVKRRLPLSLPVRLPVTDLAYDPAGDRFLVTTRNGIYLTDETLGRIIRHTVVDPGFSVDLGRFAASAFLAPDTVIAIGENKSYTILRESEKPDTDANYRYFLESFDAFEELSRSRLSTIRAKMMYILAAAYDPTSDSLYTVTVPNRKTQRLVISRFDRRDMTLSEEFTPRLAEESDLTLNGEKRSLDEYYVTGATVTDGYLYAFSAAYRTLLTFDLAAHTVTAAYAVPDIESGAGVACRNEEIYIINDRGVVSVFGRPSRGSVP